nr:MAG TPA: hypothetical protein [Caudoviricetes sp.]
MSNAHIQNSHNLFVRIEHISFYTIFLGLTLETRLLDRFYLSTSAQ